MTQTATVFNYQQQTADAWFAGMQGRFQVEGPFSIRAQITPDIAAMLLARNAENRNLVQTAVTYWSNALKNGEWELNGEPIIISDTGELNDGQHRLKAVVATGITLPTFVVFGVTRGSRKTVDSGQKRTAAHVFGMAGVPNGTAIAAACKVLMNIEAGVIYTTSRRPAELEATYKNNKDIQGSVWIGTTTARVFKQSGAMFIALHYLMSKKCRDKADAFFNTLSSGVGIIDQDDPISRLRQRLLNNLANKAKLPIMEVAAIVIKGWNMHLTGKTTKSLVWQSNNVNPEPFPQVMS